MKVYIVTVFSDNNEFETFVESVFAQLSEADNYVEKYNESNDSYTAFVQEFYVIC
jgi:hypothetical protein